MNKRAVGTQKEELAAAYLRDHGCRVVANNYRTRIGEIDLIAVDEGVLCFIEVKYRRTASAGYPEEAVTLAKIRTICRTADLYRMQHHISTEQPCRFDVVAILGNDIYWHKNAFSYIGQGGL